MAKAPEEKEPSGEAIAVVPSDLDEKTHAEMLMIYNECANSVRFAKSQQWTTTGGALAARSPGACTNCSPTTPTPSRPTGKSSTGRWPRPSGHTR